MGWVISYANEWEDHSNIWGNTPWSFDSALEPSCCLQMCHLACRLKAFSWIWLVCILDPFDFNWFMLCPWAMLFFQKLCPAPFSPVSCSFHEPHLGPQYCVYNLLEGQPEDNWPWGGKYCIVSNPSRESGLHLPCFPQQIQQQHLSVNLLGWVTGPQCLLEVNLLVASLQGQLGFQGQCLPLWELTLQIVGPKPLPPFS